jgi:glutathione S-transferase
MKLFSYPTAPSARRARIFLAEKGVPVEIEDVDLRTGQHLSSAYLAVNPQGLVPALRLDDGTIITENIAIATYIEAVVPVPPLLGVTPLERAYVLQWNARVEFEGLLPLADALRNRHPAFRGRALPGTVAYDQIPDLATRGLERVKRFLETLEAQFANREFLAGDFFSFADITAVAFVDMLAMAKLAISDTQPNLGRWFSTVRRRPSYAV